jgi:dipeptidase D
MTRLLWRADGKFDYSLARFEGGNKRNAIAREAFAEVVVPQSSVDSFKNRLQELAEAMKFEFKTVEGDLEITVESTNSVDKVLTVSTHQLILNTLYVLPHGVLAMSQDIEGLVETSNNVAMISIQEDKAVIQLSSRSSVMSALQAVRNRLKSFAELANLEIEQPEGYPGWTPNVDSPLLKQMQETHKSVFGKEAEVEAVHAGLECGIIGERFPGMDMISLGPNIEHPHSPEERCHIESVANFWKLLVAALKSLA